MGKVKLMASILALKLARAAIIATLTKEELEEYNRIKGGYGNGNRSMEK